MERVLVPVDGSQLSEEAIPHAVSLARMAGADLVFVRVVEGPDYSPEVSIQLDRMVRDEARQNRAAAEYLNALRVSHENEGLVIHIRVEIGPPANRIIACAQASTASLIVMSTRGRSPLGKLLLGSISDEVVRSGVAPVLLVRAGSKLARTSYSSGDPSASRRTNFTAGYRSKDHPKHTDEVRTPFYPPLSW